ncbi:hypothetical protein B0H12DRAFT_1153959 [Mycena haematopus]|nr:hypothetical protein B0H12DRAFT_1153959 [Mycena haematopus]
MTIGETPEIANFAYNNIYHLEEARCISKRLPDAEVVTIVDLDAKPASSLPSTPSSDLTPFKRIWLWIDDEDCSSECEPDPKRRKDSLSPNSVNESSALSLPQYSDDFLCFCKQPNTVFVDKTQCILDVPDKFQCLFLRPPRFGKTTFLTTLYQYYDIHGAKHFDERFGSLAVVTKASDPTPRHSQNLCLSFDLSRVPVYCDLAEITSRLTHHIRLILRWFLIDYAAELDSSRPDNFLDCDTGDMFSKVFDLVESHGHKLFVGVDNYDAPTQSCSLAQENRHKNSATLPQIEDLLDSCFWSPILAGTHAIDKLFVTGTLMVKYPSLHTLDCAVPGLQRACGFTEQEALDFMRSLVDETPDMVDLRRSCGDYIFSSPDVERNTTGPVLHPQLLINRIDASSLSRSHTDDPFQLLSRVLQLLPEESDISVTMDDLIELLASGAVEIGSKLDAAFSVEAVSWSTLCCAGALTYDREFANTLRIANREALSLIHTCVDKHFADRYDLESEFLITWHNYSLQGNPQPFLALMSEILRDQVRRSFGRRHETNLRGIFELVMRNSGCSPAQLAPFVLLPTDVTRVEIPAYHSDRVHVLELRTLTLLGIWQATNLNDDQPTIEALETLHEELVGLEEEALLARPYRVWSPTLNAMETVSVRSLLDPAPETEQFVAVGGAHIFRRHRQM